MRRWPLVLSILLVVYCSGATSAGRASTIRGYRIFGYLHVAPESKYAGSFKAKLSNAGGVQELFATPNKDNVFSFENLPAESFLLEVFVNDALYYQREIAKMQSDLLFAIPVGQYKLAAQVSIDEKKTNTVILPSKEMLTIVVGDIQSDLKPDTKPSNGFNLKVRLGKKTLRDVRISPPKLITTFAIGRKTYTLTGLVGKTGKTEYIQCEIYE